MGTNGWPLKKLLLLAIAICVGVVLLSLSGRTEARPTFRDIEPDGKLLNCSTCVESHCIWCPFTADCYCDVPENEVKEKCARSVFWTFQTGTEMILHKNTTLYSRFNDSTCPSIITNSQKSLCSAGSYQFDNLTMADRSVTWSGLAISIVKYSIDKLLGHNTASDIVQRVIDESSSPLLYPFTQSYGQAFVLSSYFQLHNQTAGHTEHIFTSPIGVYFLSFPTRFIDMIPITINQRPVFSITNVNDNENKLYNLTITSNGTDTIFGVQMPYAGVFGIPGDYAFGIVVARNHSNGDIQCLFPAQIDVAVDHMLRLQSGLSDVQFYIVVFGLFFLVVGVFFVLFRLLLHRIVLPAIATDKPKYKRRGTRIGKLPFGGLLPTGDSLYQFQEKTAKFTNTTEPEQTAPFSDIVPSENHSSQEYTDQPRPPHFLIVFLMAVLSGILKLLKQFWNFVLLPDDKIARKKGSDETFFLRFHRMLFWISVFCAVFFGIPLAFIYLLPSIFDPDSSRFWKDFASFSSGNIPETWVAARLVADGLNGIMLAGILITVVVLMRVGHIFRLKAGKLSFFSNSDLERFSSAACTIRISHVSRTCIDSAEFQRHFEEMFGIEPGAPNRIVRAHIALQDRTDVLYWIKKRDKWSAQLKHAEEQLSASGTQVLIHDTAMRTWSIRQFIPRLFGIFRKVRAIPVLKERVALAETNIKYGLGKIQGTGHGFVTFCNPECASTFLREVQRTPAVSFTSLAPQLNTRKWKYSKAPEADDVHWANLGYSNLYRIFTHSLLIAFIFLTAATVTTITVASTNFLETKLVEEGERLAIDTTIWEAIGDKFRNVLPYYIPTISNFVQVYAIAYGAPFQRHKTKSSEKTTIFLVASFSLVYYTIFYPTFLSQDFNTPTFLQDGIVVTSQNLFFQQMTVIFLGYVIQSAFLSKGKILLKTAAYFLWYGVIKRKRKPRILFEDDVYEYVLLVNVFLVMLMGTQIPVLLLVCLLFFGFNYLVDKALIMFVYQKPGFNSRGAILSTIAWVTGVNVLIYTILLMTFQVLESGVYRLIILSLVLLFIIIINLIELASDSANFFWVRFRLYSRVVRSYVASALLASHQEEEKEKENAGKKVRPRMDLSERISVDGPSNVDAHAVTYWCPTVSGCPDIVDRFKSHVSDDATFRAWEKEESKQIIIRAVLVIISAIAFIALILFDIIFFGTATYFSDTNQFLITLILIPLPTAIGIFGIVAGIARRRRLARYFAIGITTIMMIFTTLTLFIAIIDACVLIAMSEAKLSYIRKVESILGGFSASLFNIIIILISNGILLMIAESFTTALTQRDLIRKERAIVRREPLASKPSYTL